MEMDTLLRIHLLASGLEKNRYPLLYIVFRTLLHGSRLWIFYAEFPTFLRFRRIWFEAFSLDQSDVFVFSFKKLINFSYLILWSNQTVHVNEIYLHSTAVEAHPDLGLSKSSVYCLVVQNFQTSISCNENNTIEESFFQ